MVGNGSSQLYHILFGTVSSLLQDYHDDGLGACAPIGMQVDLAGRKG